MKTANESRSHIPEAVYDEHSGSMSTHTVGADVGVCAGTVAARNEAADSREASVGVYKKAHTVMINVDVNRCRRWDLVKLVGVTAACGLGLGAEHRPSCDCPLLII